MTVTVDPDLDKPWLELIPGLWCPQQFTVYAGEDSRSHDVYAIVVPDLEEGLLVVKQLDVRRREGGEPVTSASLRTVAVGRLIHACIPYLQTRTERRVQTPWANEDDLNHAKEFGTDERTLKRVAHIYRLSLLQEGAPTKAVASAFQISAATAARWVTKSRRAGFLGPVKGPGKAGARPMEADPS